MEDTRVGCPGKHAGREGDGGEGLGRHMEPGQKKPPEASGLCHEALGSCGADASD